MESKKLVSLFVMVLALLPMTYAAETEVWFFYGKGCPHCAEMKPFLESLQEKYPEMNLVEYEIYFNKSNLELFYKTAQAYGVEVEGVPTVFIDEKVFVGQSYSIDKEIENELKNCIEKGCVSPEDILKNRTTASVYQGSKSGLTLQELQTQTGLTWSALVGAAAVDSINPCTIAVQLILLTTILASGIRKKVLFAGLAFTTSIFISYFLMGLGIYSALEISGMSHAFYYIIVVIAFAFGILSIKDYFEYKPGGWAVEIPMSWRPKLKKILSGVTSPLGAAFVGFFCSLFLLPCSSGPYLVVLGLLAKTSTRMIAIPLLLIYNFVFVLPMIAITLLVYFGMTSVEKAKEWREKNIKKLHLVSGIIMMALAVLLALSIYLKWV